ncbi:MAG TPA: hypothetical protein DIW81_29210 [Planctomycetaceae bacterium]|nr:hypothetical protein [Rubinisphaera sp.]HCS55620.1 hypothetical protein [Planctomycetaceae bacterium]
MGKPPAEWKSSHDNPERNFRKLTRNWKNDSRWPEKEPRWAEITILWGWGTAKTTGWGGWVGFWGGEVFLNRGWTRINADGRDGGWLVLERFKCIFLWLEENY